MTPVPVRSDLGLLLVQGKRVKGFLQGLLKGILCIFKLNLLAIGAYVRARIARGVADAFSNVKACLMLTVCIIVHAESFQIKVKAGVPKFKLLSCRGQDDPKPS